MYHPAQELSSIMIKAYSHRTLVVLTTYNRPQLTELWLNAWKKSHIPDNTSLLVVQNCDFFPPPTTLYNLIHEAKPDYYAAHQNVGQDIAVFKDTVRDPRFSNFDIIFHCTDDHIPMRKDFLHAFIQPFEHNSSLALVGNHFVRGDFYDWPGGKVNDHYRTSCFAIRAAVARKLRFPRVIVNKWDCYAFEWYDEENNMTAQICNMGYTMMPVCGDKEWTECNEYLWDVGDLGPNNKDPRCRKNLWHIYKAQFEEPIDDRDIHSIPKG